MKRKFGFRKGRLVLSTETAEWREHRHPWKHYLERCRIIALKYKDCRDD